MFMFWEELFKTQLYINIFTGFSGQPWIYSIISCGLSTMIPTTHQGLTNGESYRVSVGEEVYNKPLWTTPWTNMGGRLQVSFIQPFEKVAHIFEIFNRINWFETCSFKSYFECIISLNVWQWQSIHVLTFDQNKTTFCNFSKCFPRVYHYQNT